MILRRQLSNHKLIVDRRAAYLVGTSRSVGRGWSIRPLPTRFCRQARGSLYELLDHLTVALDENFITEDMFNDLKEKILKVIKMLNGYISYLKRRKEDEKVRG